MRCRLCQNYVNGDIIYNITKCITSELHFHVSVLQGNYTFM